MSTLQLMRGQAGHWGKSILTHLAGSSLTPACKHEVAPDSKLQWPLPSASCLWDQTPHQKPWAFQGTGVLGESAPWLCRVCAVWYHFTFLNACGPQLRLLSANKKDPLELMTQRISALIMQNIFHS